MDYLAFLNLDADVIFDPEPETVSRGFIPVAPELPCRYTSYPWEEFVMMESCHFRNAGNDCLEGVISSLGFEGKDAVVLLHPHPAYGGSMDNQIILRMASSLESMGIASLRFNFRGVGASEGKHDRGKGEVFDAMAALAYLAEQVGLPPAAISVAGYSFGAYVALKLALSTPLKKLVCIAPPIKIMRQYWETEKMIPSLTIPSLFIAGDQDLVCHVPTLAALCEANKWCRLHLLAGANHFFLSGIRDNRQSVAEHVSELTTTAVKFIMAGY